jgi:RHS repeat-associated protein
VGNAKQKLTLYAGGGSGIGDAISRVTALSNEATRADEDEVYAAYAYNGAGRMVLETQKHAGATVAELDYYQSATPETYDGFDRFGRVVDQKWVHGATVLDHYGYAYDPNSNRTRRENVLAVDRSEVYGYDGLSRLTTMNRGTLNAGKTAIEGTPAREESWNLNQTGNWAGYDVEEDGAPVLNQTRTNNKANEITGIETPPEQTQWAEPAYDARGNMITVPKPNSPASAFTCTWDAWNRLVQVKDGETVVATYAYDGLNHRITKTVGETITHCYYNASWQLLETREGAGAPETLDPKEQCVWSIRYIDSPVLRDRDTDDDGDLDETLYFCNDANMNVTALVSDDGTVLERYAYTPYGKPSFFDASWNPRADSAYDNSILYCGYFSDAETGFYDVRHRCLHPTLGRWLSRDQDYYDGMSLYQYGSSSPVSVLDFSGLESAPASTGDSKCCCVGEEDKCSIKIDISWLVPPFARWVEMPVPGADAPRWVPPGTAREPPKQWEFSFGARAKAVVTLEHSEGKDVSNCHLKQDVEGRANFKEAIDAIAQKARIAQTTGRTTSPNWDEKSKIGKFSIIDDFNGRMKGNIGLMREGIKYLGYTYEDFPYVGFQVLTISRWPSTIRYWFQATVSLEEAPAVKNWWGFQLSVENWKSPGQNPGVSGNFWKDKAMPEPEWAKPQQK